MNVSRMEMAVKFSGCPRQAFPHFMSFLEHKRQAQMLPLYFPVGAQSFKHLYVSVQLTWCASVRVPVFMSPKFPTDRKRSLI